MHTCHFSDDGLKAYCGVSVAEMVTDHYTRESLDAVTCAVCLEVINDGYRVPDSRAGYCACVPAPGWWKVADLAVCPRCGYPVCVECYQQHRQGCCAVGEVVYV